MTAPATETQTCPRCGIKDVPKAQPAPPAVRCTDSPCREKAWDREQERLIEDGPGPSLLEQQREAMKFK